MGCVLSCRRCCITCYCPRETDTAEGRRRLLNENEHSLVIKQSTNIKITAEYIEKPDGRLLFGKLFEPPNPRDAKAMICHCPGLYDHLDCTPHDVGIRYAEMGFVVFICDWKGFGRSDGDFIHIQNFDIDFVDEGLWAFNYAINKYIKTNQIYSNSIDKNNLYFLSGWALGGGIAIKMAEKKAGIEIEWKGMCLIAPMVGLLIKPPQFVISLLSCCCLPMCPRAKLVENDVTIENLTEDENLRQRYLDNPVFYDQRYSLTTSYNLVNTAQIIEDMYTKQNNENDENKEDMEALLPTLPMFICHGDADKISDPKVSQLFYDNYGVKQSDKQFTVYKGRGHQLMEEEPNCMRHIGQWIHQRVEM